MYLAKLTTVNWGTLSSTTFEFTKSTLVTGESDAGKSMLLDAIQTVYTAAHGKLVKYNVAQSENADRRQRSKTYRTLPGYALGQLGNGFQRTSSHTWLAAVFAPSESEIDRPFTALIGVTAALESGTPTLNRLSLFLIRGEVTTEMLLDKNRAPRPVRGAKDHLQDLFGDKNVLPFGDNRTEYLQTLFGWFEGKPHLSEREAFSSAKALGRACAFKPVDNVNESIKTEILDEVDMREVIEKTSGIMRNIRSLVEQAKRLKAAIAALSEIEKRIAETRTHFVSTRSLEYALAHARWRTVKRNQKTADEQFDYANEAIGKIDRENERDQLEKAGLEQRRRVIEARLLELPAAGQKSQLTQEVKRALEATRARGADLTAALKGVAGLYAGRKDLLDRLSGIMQLNQALLRIDEAAQSYQAGDVAALLQSISHVIETDLDASISRSLVTRVQQMADRFVASFIEGEGALVHTVGEVHYAQRNELAELEAELAQTLRRIAALSSGRFYRPDAIEEAIDLIKLRYPDANPTVVAEHVDPKAGSPWIGAIEGFLGLDRYAILVDAKFETPAQKLLLELPRRPIRPKVLQISRLMRDGRSMSPHSGSILEELTVKSPTAKAWLTANYGNVLKVDSVEELRDVSRGITQSGMKAGGYSVQRFDLVPETERAFGTAARQAQLEASLRKRDELSNRQRVLKDRVGFLKVVQEHAVQIRRFDIATPFEQLVAAQAERKAAEKALALLDLSDVSALEAQQAELADRLAEIDMKIGSRMEDRGQFVLRREQAGDRLNEANAQEKDRETARATAAAAITELAVLDASMSVQKVLSDAETLADSQSQESLSGRLNYAHRALGESLVAVRGVVADYNRNATPNEVISAQISNDPKLAEQLDTYRQVQAVAKQTADQLLTFRSHALATNDQDLAEAEKQFNSVFTSMFAQRMCNAIDEGIYILKALNARIKGLVFGRDSYQMTWDWVPQYRAYAEFFRLIRDRSDQLIDGRTIFDMELEPDLAAVRNEVKTLLLADDANSADKRLAEITDWRNYRTYDVEISRTDQPGAKIKLSEWATGSGGETQTPFYVVRVAVLSAALRHGNDSKTHLYSLVLDEAFAAMDGERSRKAMELQQKTFGFQVIVVMPTKNAGAVKPLFDREYQFAMVDAQPAGSGKRVTTCRMVELNHERVAELFRSTYEKLAQVTRADMGVPAPEDAAGGDSPDPDSSKAA